MNKIKKSENTSKPKQATLFQSWGGTSQPQDGAHKSSSQKSHLHHNETISLLDDDDEEDQELARALEESLADHENSRKNVGHASSNTTWPVAQTSSTHDGESEALNISFGREEQETDHCGDRNNCLSQWKSSDRPVGELPGFDQAAGQLWIYPTNYPIREYQFNIVQKAMVKNTLVTLPTGLGKTFIASVIMYNFYRWYPEGKVVFMAPTKPLVAQQIEACYNIMGIPQEDTAEMTGSMNPTDRQKTWRDRRVFFLTPQVMTNDLSRGTCPAEVIKCVVIDEAHKALGNHAYCQVIRELIKYTQQFRVLALSATPGSDIKSVQNVISNLAISHIEIRSEESADIKPYTHERIVEKVVVPLGDELTRIKTKYIQVLSVVVRRLIQQRVLYNREPTSLSKFLILKAREAFRQNPPESLPRNQYGVVEGDFALAMSLYHGFELLQLHGLRSVFNFLDGIVTGDKAYGRTRTELLKNADFNEIMENLREKFQPRAESSLQAEPALLMGHPKMVKLEAVVLEHFRRFEAEGQPTRVMIFSQYRDSVQEITTILQQHQPLVKVMSFIGQSSVGKATKGFTQKEQLKVMQEFRTGGYNTLVATCVGEEGLDIGDVDLIVCFDAHKSPIRLVQRMGRTGRKRQGRIVMLVTEGKEEQIYNHSQYTKRSIHRAIQNGARSLVFYPNNPRMIPADITPACHCMHITVKQQQQQEESAKQKDKGKGQDRINKLSAKTRAKNKKCVQEEDGISLEEFAELKSFGPAVVTKHLPAPRMITLQPLETEDQNEQDNTVLDVAEWLPWQNTLQQTTYFGHSRRSLHLVELLEFTDLQQVLPPAEDNYGQEMKIYLDMDDVFSDQRRPKSSDITQFVVPSQRNRDTRMEGEGREEKRERHLRRKKTEAGKRLLEANKRKKKHVQPIEVDENSDDSDFLPDVDFSVTSASRFESPTVRANVVGLMTEGTVSSEAVEGKNKMSPEGIRGEKLENVLTDVGKENENMLTDADEMVEHNVSLSDGDRASENNSLSNNDHMSTDTSDDVFRFRPPPPLSHIPLLLSAVTPESLDAAAIIPVVRSNIPPPRLPGLEFFDSTSSFAEEESVVDRSGIEHEIFRMVEPPIELHGGPDVPVPPVGLHGILGVSFPLIGFQGIPGVSELAFLENRMESEMETNYNDPVEDEAAMDSSDLLSDSEFEALGLKLLNEQKVSANKHTLKGHETDSDGGDLCSAKNCSGQVEGSDVQASNEPGSSEASVGSPQVALSQVEVKSRKPLFRPGDSDTHASAVQHTTATTPTFSARKQKSKISHGNSVHIPVPEKQQICPETKQSSEREHDSFQTAQGSISESVQENASDITVTDASRPSEGQTPLPDSWVTGRQFLISERQKRKATETDHTVIPENSMSDSFLQQNFLDDDDFESNIPQSMQNQLTGRSAQNTSNIHTADHPSKKSTNLKLSVSPKTESSLRSPGFLSPVESPHPEKEQASRNESMYTFTQALQYVHSPSAPGSNPDNLDDHISKSLGMPVEGREGDIGPQDNVLSAAPDEAEEDSPNFDLGFDFDEDVILPSPEMEPPVMSHVFPMKSGKSDSGEGESSNNIPNKGSCLNDDVLFDEGEEEQDSPCFTSSFQSKPLPAFTLGSSLPMKASEDDQNTSTVTACLDTENLPKIERRESLSYIVRRKLKVSEGALSGDEELDDGSSSQHKNKSSPVSISLQLGHPAFASQGFTSHENCETRRSDTHSTQNETANCSTAVKNVSPDHSSESLFPRKMSEPAQPRLSSIGTSHPQEDIESDGLGEFTANFALNADIEDDFDSDFEFPSKDGAEALTKSPFMPPKFSGGVSCSTPVSNKKGNSLSLPSCSTGPNKTDGRSTKRKHIASFSLAHEDDDGSDFEESVVAMKKPKAVRLLSSDDSELDNISVDAGKEFKVPPRKKEKAKRKRKRGCGFLDDEAEQSDDLDVSSDEAEDNLDMLEGSFIDNCTQMTQASQIDMQAVYMKSVRSPEPHRGGRGGKYRLQYSPAHVSIVYSQPQDPEDEESQYQEDSFCVGSEEEESNYGDSDEEISVIQATKKCSKEKKRPAVKQVKGRQRVLQLADSSSNEDEEFERLPPTQVIPTVPRSKKSTAVKALLSSSDENLDVSAIDPPSFKGIESRNTGFEKSDKVRIDVAARSKSSQGFEVSCSDKVKIGTLAAETLAQQQGEDFSRPAPDAPFKKNLSVSGNKSIPDVSTSNLPSANARNYKGADSSISSPSVTKLSSKPDEDLSRETSIVNEKPAGRQGTSEGGGDAYEEREPGVSFSLVRTGNLAGRGDGFTNLATGERGKMVILVDSREISGAQDIVSSLRLEHNIQVYTRQLTACDYILSNRMAVDRLNWSSFSNSTNRNKLAERVQQMQSLYDRCVIIVEKDRIKPGEEKQERPQHHSKYLDTVLAQLNQTAVRIFFSDNQGETANLLSQLTAVEYRKNMAITVPVNLSSEREQVVKFYLSIPRLTVTHALNLAYNFRTIHEFMRSSVNAVQTKGHMSFSRATEVVNFVRRRFSKALTSK